MVPHLITALTGPINELEQRILDSMPAIRHAILDVLTAATAPAPIGTIADAIRYPTTTTRRALADLQGHGIVTKNTDANADLWAVTGWARDRWPTAPETSEPLSTSLPSWKEDKTGTIESVPIDFTNQAAIQ